MQTSERGRKLIETFEGLRLKAYRDIVGIWTIGYGHTSKAGKPLVVAGMTVTQVQADQILTSDLDVFERGVLAVIKKPMAQSEFDAFMSLSFNIGVPAFQSSSVVRAFNRGDKVGAGNAFRLWIRAGGEVVPDLVRRREAERAEYFFPGAGDVVPSEPENMPAKVDNPHGVLQRIGAGIEKELAGLWA